MPASDGPFGERRGRGGGGVRGASWPRPPGPENHGPVPTFDVLLLGVGPDTHVASLFPELPAVRETERTVVGVHGAPEAAADPGHPHPARDPGGAGGVAAGRR